MVITSPQGHTLLLKYWARLCCFLLSEMHVTDQWHPPAADWLRKGNFKTHPSGLLMWQNLPLFQTGVVWQQWENQTVFKVTSSPYRKTFNTRDQLLGGCTEHLYRSLPPQPTLWFHFLCLCADRFSSALALPVCEDRLPSQNTALPESPRVHLATQKRVGALSSRENILLFQQQPFKGETNEFVFAVINL